MTEVKVINKFINILPIQELIQRTESLVDDIYFLIDNYVDDVDFSDWSWRIYYKTSLDDGYTTLLDSEYDEENLMVRVHWKPSADICRRSGWLTIQLRGSKDTDGGLLKWNTSVASINIGRALNAGSEEREEPILEEYLDRFESLAQSSAIDYQQTNVRLNNEINRATAAEADLQRQIDEKTVHLETTKVKLNLATSFERGESGLYETLCIGIAPDLPATTIPDYVEVVSDVRAHY